MKDCTQITPAPGAPVVHGDYSNADRTGWIASVIENENEVYSLGSGAMQREFLRVVVVFEDLSFTEISEGIAAPWMEKAQALDVPHKSEADALAMLDDAKAEQARKHAQRQAESEAEAERVSAWRDTIRDKIPANAKAVIVAQLMQDQSDSMTDYFASRPTKAIILAFSTHTRDLFPEMRKAAKNHTSTAHLADAPASAENRQKYSMGGGYFLKEGGRHSTGWKISKQVFYANDLINDRANLVPYGEWSVPAEAASNARTYTKTEAVPEAVALDVDAPEGFTVTSHTHTKKGFQMFIVEQAERVGRETFMRQLEQAKSLRGWYSRKWGSTPAGFAFKDQAAVVKFLEAVA